MTSWFTIINSIFYSFWLLTWVTVGITVIYSTYNNFILTVSSSISRSQDSMQSWSWGKIEEHQPSIMFQLKLNLKKLLMPLRGFQIPPCRFISYFPNSLKPQVTSNDKFNIDKVLRSASGGMQHSCPILRLKS